jgi:hypothetical protein
MNRLGFIRSPLFQPRDDAPAATTPARKPGVQENQKVRH